MAYPGVADVEKVYGKTMRRYKLYARLDFGDTQACCCAEGELEHELGIVEVESQADALKHVNLRFVEISEEF
jgi:hypothetical protein